MSSMHANSCLNECTYILLINSINCIGGWYGNLCLIGELLLYITTRYIWYLHRHLCYLDLLLFQLITQQSEYLHWILLHEVGFFPVD